MNNSKQFLRVFYRQMSQAQTLQKVPPRSPMVKDIQKKYQLDDGIPVHIKSGLADKLLFRTTFALTMIGVGMSLDTFIRIVFK